MKKFLIITLLLSNTSFILSSAEQCGCQAEAAVCPNGFYCSKFGYCGATWAYYCKGCQSQCSCDCGRGAPSPNPPSGGGGVGSVPLIIISSLFNQMLLHRNDAACHAHGFYTYDAFIATANSFPGFGTTEDGDTRKRRDCCFPCSDLS